MIGSRPGSEEASYDLCTGLWLAVPASQRLPLLLEVVARYRHRATWAEADPHDAVAMIRSGRSTNDLIIAGYRLAAGRERKKLQMEPDEEQSLTILRTAFHFCGHGEDTEPPLRFALRHFERKLYSAEFFCALRAYRAVLAQASAHTAVQRLKGEIDLLLWQDLATPLPGCWTARFRQLADAEKTNWQWLWHSFCYSPLPAAPKRWKAAAALATLGHAHAAKRLLGWINEPTPSSPVITTAGSAALKNIVWVATVLNHAPLDEALHRATFRPWKNPRPLDKVAGALVNLWSGRHTRADREARIAQLRQHFRA